MAAKKKAGRVIRVSKDLELHLTCLRRHNKESFDSVLRRAFGLPSFKGHEQPLRTYFIVDTPDDLLVRRTLAEARGEAILLAVKRGQRRTDKKATGVLKVRELA